MFTFLAAANSSIRISLSGFCIGLRVYVDCCGSTVDVGGGRDALTWKKGYCNYCEAVGRCNGSYLSRSLMSAMASGEALGIILVKGVTTNCGNLKLI